VITVRTERERVMLEALEWINSCRHSDGCPILWGGVCGGLDGDDLCALFYASLALAKVRQLDTATPGQEP
jgi:hypothetical protein